LKKILLTVLCLLTITSVIACGAPHNPDGTFGQSIKGTFYDHPERADYSPFGVLVAMPRYREGAKDAEREDAPGPTDSPRALNLTGDAELNTFDLNPNSYDPDLSRIVENHVEAISGVNDARVFVFAYHAFVGIDASGNEEFLLHQQVYQTVQRQVAGREVRISDDPSIFTRLGDVEHQLYLGR
jgi:hypothetical protein